MTREKHYVVAPGKAISCKNGVIAEGEVISWQNMPDPLCKKGADKLDGDKMEDLKKKNFKALLNSDKVLVIEKREPYAAPEVTDPPEVPDPPAGDKPPEDLPPEDDEPAGGAKRKKKKD